MRLRRAMMLSPNSSRSPSAPDRRALAISRCWYVTSTSLRCHLCSHFRLDLPQPTADCELPPRNSQRARCFSGPCAQWRNRMVDLPLIFPPSPRSSSLSGKSTQVPTFILEDQLSHGKPCKIFCTEPRRISAISLAQRVSRELGDAPNAVGTNASLVGYSIRLESNTSKNTRLTFVTNGIALRMLESGSGQSGSGTAFDEITVYVLCLVPVYIAHAKSIAHHHRRSARTHH